MRILLIEDDPLIAEGLTKALKRGGYTVDAVTSRREAEAMLTTDYALVLLDLGLPDGDGLDLLKRIRSKKQPLPVIVLTARDSAAARVKGLDLGADDYVVKPFDLAELEARIRAVTRRSAAGVSADLQCGPLTLIRAERRVLNHATPLELTPREYALVELLMLRHGRVVSKSQIQDQLAEWEDGLSDAAIEVLVHRLRKKLDLVSGIEVKTLRGFGYLLQAE